MLLVSAAQHESATHTHTHTHTHLLSHPVLSHPPPHPYRWLQSTKRSFHCYTHSSFPLAIYLTHGSVHMSMRFSQFVPPSPWPQVCSLCLHLYSCPANRFIGTIFLDSYICINIRYLCFSFWLTSLCLTASRFMYFSSADSHLFLFMAECASFYTRVEQACVFVCVCV